MTPEEKQALVNQFNAVGTLLRLINAEVQSLAVVIERIEVDVGVTPLKAVPNAE